MAFLQCNSTVGKILIHTETNQLHRKTKHINGTVVTRHFIKSLYNNHPYKFIFTAIYTCMLMHSILHASCHLYIQLTAATKGLIVYPHGPAKITDTLGNSDQWTVFYAAGIYLLCDTPVTPLPVDTSGRSLPVDSWGH